MHKRPLKIGNKNKRVFFQGSNILYIHMETQDLHDITTPSESNVQCRNHIQCLTIISVILNYHEK